MNLYQEKHCLLAKTAFHNTSQVYPQETYTILFLNGQYIPVVCPFDHTLCQLTANLVLHTFSFPFFLLFPLTLYWKSSPKTLMFIIKINK